MGRTDSAIPKRRDGMTFLADVVAYPAIPAPVPESEMGQCVKQVYSVRKTKLTSLNQQHSIAKGEKAVAFIYGVVVDSPHLIKTGKC